MPTKKKTNWTLPQGIKLIHEDKEIIIIDKPAGLLTVSTEKEKFRTVYSILSDFVKRSNPRNKIFIVHRLDKDTSGILIFAKSEKVKRFMQEQWENSEKNYLALLHGHLSKKEDSIISLLAENKTGKVFTTKDSGEGKYSRSDYRVLKENKADSLVLIKLLTGRKHQIRVQFAGIRHPVLGDKKYGDEDSFNRLALHAYSVSFLHPFRKREMTVYTEIPSFLKNFTKDISSVQENTNIDKTAEAEGNENNP